MKPIVGSVKQYHWGKRADESLISDLLNAAGYESLATIERDKPVAEYWLGTHPSGCLRFIDGHPVDFELPFLMKVLCVNECLSVQLHPDKKTAKELHESDPSHYPDPNPKPELVIALTPLRALCGFRSVSEIADTIEASGTLQGVCSDAQSNCTLPQSDQDLKSIVAKVLSLESHRVPDIVDKCIQELGRDRSYCRLMQELRHTYPNDPGLLLPLFLRLHELCPGESLFVPAFVPHAYLAGGDAIEVMVCSDNVIRAALTPKFKDMDNLLRLVSTQEVPKLKPLTMPMGLQCYRPPGEQFFEVRSLTCTCNEVLPLRYPPLDRPSILLVMSGRFKLANGKQCKRGQSFLVDADEQLVIVEGTAFPIYFFQAY